MNNIMSTMNGRKALEELIAHAATHETTSPLETMFDVVNSMIGDPVVKHDLDVMIFNLIKKHPAY